MAEINAAYDLLRAAEWMQRNEQPARRGVRRAARRGAWLPPAIRGALGHELLGVLEPGREGLARHADHDLGEPAGAARGQRPAPAVAARRRGQRPRPDAASPPSRRPSTRCGDRADASRPCASAAATAAASPSGNLRPATAATSAAGSPRQPPAVSPVAGREATGPAARSGGLALSVRRLGRAARTAPQAAAAEAGLGRRSRPELGEAAGEAGAEFGGGDVGGGHGSPFGGGGVGR